MGTFVSVLIFGTSKLNQAHTHLGLLYLVYDLNRILP